MFSGSFAERELSVSVRTDEGSVPLGTYRVELPTARQAISLIQAEQAEGGWPVAREIILEWLPVRLASQLVGSRFKRENAMAVAKRLMAAGLPEDFFKAQSEVREDARETGWSTLVARYRYYLNGDLDDPWPYFVRQIREIDRIKAEEEMSFITAYGTARTGNRDAMDSLWKRRGFNPKKLSELSDEELAEESQKNLERFKQMHEAKTARTNG